MHHPENSENLVNSRARPGGDWSVTSPARKWRQALGYAARHG